MTDDEIVALWRKHKEVMSFAHELLNAEREICAKLADETEKKHSIKKVGSGWEWVSPAAEAIRARIK